VFEVILVVYRTILGSAGYGWLGFWWDT
jgi:hypothetical protein